MVVPFQTPVPIVPTPVSDDVTTFEASVVPVSVPAGAALNVAKVPKLLPFVLVQVIAPVFAIVQSPLIELNEGSEVAPCPISNCPLVPAADTATAEAASPISTPCAVSVAAPVPP